MATRQSIDSLAQAAKSAEGSKPKAKLTAKETQILMWCFKGKTSWEIARIENCTESTVNFHFANIRRKFDVSSRTCALLRAIESGAIQVDSVVARGAHEPD
ncbi:helix-turn-helix domain-containing protein [Pseudomonas sp. PDM28]|jgi:DNA-binding CsgD family transcriptional regulator|uniref:helix-turn-helix domain-containing protein n=1 Tax=Pseudomonas sp. PDM28 TaxID=2854770 RepID=UPI001C451889|nr:helix-turn-helix domain-containing protein [Pseudomonas sp. PDM28]MBV7553411.1 helix-turn-helix domain-containing protein [Pseudomonas sp. PDM28]